MNRQLSVACLFVLSLGCGALAEERPWRFQGDIFYGETDPTITVFMGDVEIDKETGQTVVRQDTRSPVTMKLSELQSAMYLADPKKMGDMATAQRAARVEAQKQQALDREKAQQEQQERPVAIPPQR